MDKATKILVVDDDPIFLAVTEEILGSLGYRHINAVEDASVAAAMLRESDFGLIVLDLNMPGLDGLGFLRQAAEAQFKGRLIISSGESEAVLRTAAQLGRMLQITVSGALKKPPTVSKIKELLEMESFVVQAASSPPLPETLEDLELVPYYQAQHDGRTGAVVGVEALIRGKSRAGTIFGPGKLFSMVQSHEQMVSTTLGITEAVLHDVRAWTAHRSLCRTAINLDISLAEDPSVLEQLVGLVKKAGVDPRSICWEITETTLPKDMTRLMEGLGRLRMAGFELALDDYGTGGSNFEVLRLCPFTELKIDGALLRSAPEELVTQRFVAAAVGMAHDLDLQVVGEGVETRSQYAFANQAGIRIIQGFFFSRPMPFAEIDELIRGKRYVLVSG